MRELSARTRRDQRFEPARTSISQANPLLLHKISLVLWLCHAHDELLHRHVTVRVHGVENAFRFGDTIALVGGSAGPGLATDRSSLAQIRTEVEAIQSMTLGQKTYCPTDLPSSDVQPSRAHEHR